MNKKIFGLILSSPFLIGSSVIAGEIGVTNSYGHSFRSGRGTTDIQFQTNSQLLENSSYGSVKVETSSYGFGEGSGPGNSGNTPAAGNSNSQNHLNNLQYGDSVFSRSQASGTRNYRENTNVTGNTNEVYSFGSTNFTHSVGAYAQ